MHFLFAVLLFLAIVWILTCTQFGRIVVFVSVVVGIFCLFGGIAVHDYQQTHKPTPEQTHAEYCARAPSAAEYLRMDEDVREVYQSLFKDCANMPSICQSCKGKGYLRYNPQGILEETG